MDKEFLKKLSIDSLMSSLVQYSYGLHKIKTEQKRKEIWEQIHMIEEEIKSRCE